jgi:hypothetical protein
MRFAVFIKTSKNSKRPTEKSTYNKSNSVHSTELLGNLDNIKNAVRFSFNEELAIFGSKENGIFLLKRCRL